MKKFTTFLNNQYNFYKKPVSFWFYWKFELHLYKSPCPTLKIHFYPKKNLAP